MPDTFVGDFTNVEERDFKIKHLPSGDYPARVTKVIDHTSKDGNPNWLYTITITSGPGKGAAYPYYVGLDTKQLWKVKQLYAGCGLNIPKKKVRLKREQCLGKECGISLEDDEYEGKMKSVISAVIPLSEIGQADDDDVAEEEEEEVEETPPPRAKKKSRPAPPPVEEDEDDEIDLGDDEEEEEEPPPPPRKKKAAPAKAAAKKRAAPVVDEDELEELEIEDL
jgi:hypothetical protein